jgi:hypothetical protein
MSMVTYIVGHGELALERPETIVPEESSITFWTNVDSDILLRHGMRALQEASTSDGAQTYDAGQPVPNYTLYRLSDNERLRYETVANDVATAWYVGDQLPHPVHLCDATDPDMCSGGRHICGGVFGRLTGEIVYLACRGLVGEANNQLAYGGTDDTSNPFAQMVNELLGLPEEDAGARLAAMEDARDADAQETLAYLMNFQGLRKAVYKYRTRQYVPTAAAMEVEAMFFDQPEPEKSWMWELPEIQQAVGLAQRKRDYFIAKMQTADPRSLADELASEPERDRYYLLMIPGLQDLVTGADISRMLDEGGA